jgi:putative N6-adenine-specific DNA methylase
VPVKVEASCRASKIYHAGAAAQRVEQAIADALGPATEGDDPIRLMVRIERNLVTISVDTSGAPLHRRGFKEFVGKAPMRETMAALFLRACGWDGTRPLVDPMCGSGTILLEGGALAAGLQPGRGRGFDWQRLAPPELHQDAAPLSVARPDIPPILGFDRDDGAVRGAGQNVERAGLAGVVTIARAALSDLAPPPGPPGLVLTNPPYGARIGKPGPLHGLYATLGAVLKERFRGWEAGILTSEPGLARTTGLPFAETGPFVPHGSLKIRLYRTKPLP